MPQQKEASIKYLGSKAAHAAEIIAIATANRKPGSTWCEPFVGGGNVICRVPPEQGPRLGSDVNWRMIELLDAIGNRGWVPPDSFSKEEYEKIRSDPDSYPPELVAFVATTLSFGGKWFAGFVGETYNDKGKIRRYLDEGRNAVLRDTPGLRGVKFLALRYEELTPHIPPESIIYCDPPYAGTTGYGGARTDIEVGQDLSLNSWNRVAFWRWADQRVDEGHSVFVSEYAGPPSSIYSGLTPELKAARAALMAEARQSDADIQRLPRDALFRAQRTSITARQVELARKIKAESERQAARWEVLWEKEVVSDFDTERGTEAKKNVEKLFHRRA
jgi:DNA adenine methylase